MPGGTSGPRVADSGYRVEFVQVKPGCLRQELELGAQIGLPYLAFGEYDLLFLRKGMAAAAILSPPSLHEFALSVHVMPLFVWDVGCPDLDVVSASDHPILGVFALRVAAQRPASGGNDDTPVPRSGVMDTWALARDVVPVVRGKGKAVCGGVGFFDIVVLTQTRQVSDIKESLLALHRMRHPRYSEMPAFCAVSPVVAVRAEIVRHSIRPELCIRAGEAGGEQLGAHICMGYRPGMFGQAVERAATTASAGPDLMVARYDLEVVRQATSLADIASISLGLQGSTAGEFCEVRTALSFSLSPTTTREATSDGRENTC